MKINDFAVTATVDPITEADLEETATLKRYLQKYDDQCTGNSELTIWMDKLLRASKLPKSKLAEKIATRIGFESYNQERLNLESSINARLEELDDILPQQIPNSRCSKFYLKQRTNLRKAKSLPNAKKSVVLLENSKACP
ncbi:hypothetical protein KR018_001069, partial [Drosophila ironensis]